MIFYFILNYFSTSRQLFIYLYFNYISYQIKLLLLSYNQQHVCRDEWKAWERAPDSAEYNRHV